MVIVLKKHVYGFCVTNEQKKDHQLKLFWYRDQIFRVPIPKFVVVDFLDPEWSEKAISFKIV